MSRLCHLACAAILAAWLPAGVAFAQEAEVENPTLGESGAAYLSATRFSRIDSDVVYYNPFAPPPELETSAEPEAPRDRAQSSEGDFDVPVFLIAAVILSAMAYIIFQASGGISVSMRRQGEDAKLADRAGLGRGKTDINSPRSLEAILALKDRREALPALAARVLADTLDRAGILEQKSWTAREALRRLPRDQDRLSDIRAVVSAAELVQFGGRDIGEEEFGKLLAGVRPLMTAAST